VGQVLAILAPGQGAQQQGFLAPWLEIDGVKSVLRGQSDLTGVDLVAAGTTMSKTDITDTAVAQPLIVAASLLAASLLPDLPRRTLLAGHSVGEFAAAALAGALSDAAALRLISIRGAAMAAASRTRASGMTAVLGGDAAAVQHAILGSGCSVANVNATGQVVAAGTTEALDHLAAAPPERARLRPLAVAGAFHTHLMAPARDSVADAAGRVSPQHATYGVVSNVDGAVLTNGAEILSRLVSQVCSPVRWDLCMRTMRSMGVTATIELAPAGTLTALVRRELPEVVTLALQGPEDLAAAAALIDEHSAELTDEAPPWQLLVAPSSGTVQVPDAAPDAGLAAGDVVVRVATRTEALEVCMQRDGQLVELLVHDGDPVSEGQPLARVTTEVGA
jgi:[acyl-carrier-protein] S-malonyltransferase